MHIGTTTLAILSAYELPALFFGGFFFGETVIIPAAFLSGQGVFSLAEVFSITFLGTIIADALWFFAGPPLFRFAHRFEWIAARSEATLKRIDALYANQPFRALLVSKFVYGTRVLTVIYLSFRRISALRFLAANLLGTFVWLAAIVVIGWLAGKSIVNLIPFVSNATYALLIVLLLIVGFKLAPLWLQKRSAEAKSEPPDASAPNR
ncbi:MAG: VTT domain-containing protein [Patescibacteria group bacterium]